MNIKQLIQEGIREALSELYPAGAENDPSAPWLQNGPEYSKPISPSGEMKVIGFFPGEIAILEDKNGRKYAFYFGHISKGDFAQYAEREITHSYKGEEGPEHEYSEYWVVDAAVIERYVNDNIETLTKGVGAEGWEKGLDLVEIDEDLRRTILNMYGENETIKSALSQIRGSISQIQ